ncbi:MAG: reverse transcriptase N-terminal domain-containing protein [Promethearchaeota archaeon]
MCESIEQNKGRVVDWDSIQWNMPKQHVRQLQKRIFRATREKDWAKVKNLQKLLVRSRDQGFLRREPHAGKLARGAPKRGRG